MPTVCVHPSPSSVCHRLTSKRKANMQHLAEMAKQQRRSDVFGRHMTAALGLQGGVTKQRGAYSTSYIRAHKTGASALAKCGIPCCLQVRASVRGGGSGRGTPCLVLRGKRRMSYCCGEG